MADSNNDITNAEEDKQPENEINDEKKDEKTEEMDEESVTFIQQVETALNSAKSANKLLMVLCENAQEVNAQIWNQQDIVKSIKKHAICLLLREGTLAFHQFTILYPVISFPTVYHINPNNGMVLQCNFRDEDINIESILKSIDSAYKTMIESQKEANNRTQLQIREITQSNNNANNNTNDNNNNTNNDNNTDNDTNLDAAISIQEMDQRSEDSMQSSLTSIPPTPKKKSTLSKLEQIRYVFGI